jgi:hypothetical protein
LFVALLLKHRPERFAFLGAFVLRKVKAKLGRLLIEGLNSNHSIHASTELGTVVLPSKKDHVNRRRL